MVRKSILSVIPKLQSLDKDRLQLIIGLIDSCLIVQSLEDNSILKMKVGDFNGSNIIK